MFLLLPKTIHSGHFAYAAASDKLLGGQTASTLLTRALGEPPFISAMVDMAFSAERSGETHFDNVATMLAAVLDSLRSSLPSLTRELFRRRGGYTTALIKPAVNEPKVVLATIDIRRFHVKCKRMGDALKSIEDAKGTDGRAIVLAVAGIETLKLHMVRRLPTPAAAMQPALALALMQILVAAQLVAAQRAAQRRLPVPPPAAAMPAAHPPVPAPAAPIIQLLVPAPPPAAALLAALLAAHPPAAAQPAPGAGNRFSHLPITALKRKYAAVSVARAALNEQGGAEEPTVRRGVRPSVVRVQVVISDDDDDSASETE
jgi:hypothetical protein